MSASSLARGGSAGSASLSPSTSSRHAASTDAGQCPPATAATANKGSHTSRERPVSSGGISGNLVARSITADAAQAATEAPASIPSGACSCSRNLGTLTPCGGFSQRMMMQRSRVGRSVGFAMKLDASPAIATGANVSCGPLTLATVAPLR